MTNPSSDSPHIAPGPARIDDQRRGFATRVAQGYEPDDGPLSPAQVAAVQVTAKAELPKGLLSAEVVCFFEPFKVRVRRAEKCWCS